jgi:hypothetical protein
VSVSQARHEHLKALALQTFAAHEITHRDERSVVLQKRYKDGAFRSEYAAEIVAGRFGYLIVTGDINTMVFGRQGGTLRARLGWIGGHDNIGYYVRQKAVLGTDAAEMVDRFVPELAADLRDHLLEDLDEGEPGDAAAAARIREAFESADPDDPDSIIERLGEAGLCDAWEYREWLTGPRERVYFAWAACRRAAELIDAADASATAGGAQ